MQRGNLFRPLLLVVVLPACPLAGQDGEVARRDEQRRVSPGDRVQVTTVTGCRFEGRIGETTDVSFVMDVSSCSSGQPAAMGGWRPQNVRAEACPPTETFEIRDIAVLRQQYRDGVGNGALIGFGGGLAFAIATSGAQDFDGKTGDALGAWLTLAAVGTGVGMLIDGLNDGWRDVYRRDEEGTGRSAAAGLLFRRGRVGVVASVRF